MKFSTPQLAFIHQNFNLKTSKALFNCLVSDFDYQHCYTSFRSELYRVGYHKVIMRRWSKSETTFLLDNFRIMGNVEIAKLISKGNRIFTKQQVQKKIKLLKLKRTQEDLKNILDRNKANGIYVLGAKRTWITRNQKTKSYENNIY